MPSSKELEEKLQKSVLKCAAELASLQNQYASEVGRVKTLLENCESDAEAQQILSNFQEYQRTIVDKMNKVKSDGAQEAQKITNQIQEQKRRELEAEERLQQWRSEEEQRKKREQMEREQAELDRKRRDEEEENRRKVEEMKERMKYDEEYIRQYIVNLRINGFGGGVAVYNGEKIVGAAADASLGPVANARVGMVATLTDKKDEKAIDYNLAKVGLFDDAVKARAGVKVGVKDEGPAAGSAYINLAQLDIADGAVGADAGLKTTVGVQDSSGRTGLIAEANIANANVGPVNASLGLSATTAFRADNGGVSAEVLGTGFSVGDNGIKIKLFGSSIGFGW